MMISKRIWLAAALALIALVACKDDVSEPPGGKVSLPKRDAGREVIEDSGILDASRGVDEDGGGDGPGGLVAGECLNVSVANVINEESETGYDNAITAPADLGVTRVVATWKAGCAQPKIDIEMSEGSCPFGMRHNLVFSFDANAIDSGKVHLGENTLTADSETVGIGVSYTRPSLLRPSGKFGTCPGASGKIAFRGKPSTKAGSRLQGLFQMELAPCDGGTEPAPSITGTFNVKLVRGLEEVCPSP